MRDLALSLIIFAMVLVSCVAADPMTKDLCLIADFNDGIQNYVGGYYNKFEKSPSKASTFLARDIYPGHAGYSLRVVVDRKEEGFCGIWMHLFDFHNKPPQYFDATPYDYLSFWVKGEKGGEEFTVKLADADWVVQEDALPVGSVNQFLASHKVTTQWQEVLVPIKQFNTLDFVNMGGITLDFDTPGRHAVYIDDITFKKSQEVVTPVTERSEAADTVQQKAFPKAMWVWSTNEMLDNETARQELFEFCKQEGVNQLWVQILYKFEPDVSVSKVPTEGLPEDLKCIFQHGDQFRRFNREAHSHNISVHVLDGYPEFAQKVYHPMPLAIVDAAIGFNKTSKPEERFDGIHFDNEPYLIIGSRDRKRNEQILKEFLELNEECQKRVRGQSGMVFGVDIPFFWDKWDPEAGMPIGGVRYHGVVKPATFHCIDMLDNVGIMNYRDTADGADGMIAHGMGILAYAEQVNKKNVYMGIETFTYAPTDVWFAVGLPKELFSKVIQHRGKALSHMSRINGFRTQIYDDGDYIHVGIELPPSPSPQQTEKIRKTVIQIADRLGASSYPQLKGKVDRIRAIAINRISSDVEWRSGHEKIIFDPDTQTKYAGMIATSIMLPKITFAQESPEEIKAQIGAAENFFRKYTSYAGIAVHYYQTYRDKLRPPKLQPEARR